MRTASFSQRSTSDLLQFARQTARAGHDQPAGILARAALVRHANNLLLWHSRIGRGLPRPSAVLLLLLRRHVIDRDGAKRLREVLAIGDRCSALVGEPVHFSEVAKLIDEVQLFVDSHPVDERGLAEILRSYHDRTGFFGDPEDGADWWKGGGDND